VESTETRSVIEQLAPVMLLVFGLGWLVGADAGWYWGALAVGGAAYWMYRRHKENKGDTIIPPEKEDV